MNLSSAQAILAGSAAVLAAIVATVPALLPAVLTLACGALLAFVAFAAQSRLLRDRQQLVYRPVYARRQAVQRRVSSDD